jgi:hypothetical protein
VAWRLGETAEARSALEEVLSRSKDASTAFLAHLFLGRIDEDAGRLEEAARSYGVALALVATAQSAASPPRAPAERRHNGRPRRG